MAIRDWHVGKLVIVWVIAAALWLVLRAAMPEYNTFTAMLNNMPWARTFTVAGDTVTVSPRHPGYTHLEVTLVWLAVAVLPASVVTWKWLSGRENEPVK